MIRIEPQARLIVGIGGATDLVAEAAIAGVGVIQLFEDWLRPHVADGALQPILGDWRQFFRGFPRCHPNRRLVPPPLEAFIGHVRRAA